MALLSRTVAQTTDDAHIRQDGTSYSHTLNTAIIRSGITNTLRWSSGFRFQNITIPQGTTITDAKLKLYVLNTTYDDIDAEIFGEDVDNSATFSSGSDPDSRARTSASTNPIFTGLGIGIVSLDIITQVQEILNRGGWSSGNAMSILAIGRTSFTQRELRVQAYPLGFPTNSPAILEITYPSVEKLTSIGGIFSKTKIQWGR